MIKFVVMQKPRSKTPSPIFQIVISPLANDESHLSEDICRKMSRLAPIVWKDSVIVEGPLETMISGQKAGYMKVHYSIKSLENPKTYHGCHETWIVTTNKYYYGIIAGTMQDEDYKTRKEITAILNSIKIE